MLVDGVADDLSETFYQIAEEKEITIKSLDIMPDHVHMFIEFDPRRILHKVIKDFNFKGISSRILREKHPTLKSRLPTLWTRSYFSCSVGYISEKTIRSYIRK